MKPITIHPAASQARRLVLMLAILGLAGCASLPTNGPTRNVVLNGANTGDIPAYTIVPLDKASPSAFADLVMQKRLNLAETLGPGLRALDVIAPGDQLDIRVYEIGISLFAGSQGPATTPGNDLAAHSERFQNVVVDSEGTINLPYLGRISVAGQSIASLERKLRANLAGKSQRPEVLVNLSDSPRSSVTLLGNVRKPGRVLLTPSGEHLLDAIAGAGGTTEQSYDSVVRMTRAGKTIDVRLSAIDAGDDNSNLAIAPGDRIEILKQAQTFLALGATNRVAQINFDAERLSLAEAVAKMTGPSDNLANPRGVFVFRDEPRDNPTQPRAVYMLDLMKPQSYLLAQRFYLHDKDAILISNARVNVAAKLVGIINQLFSPAVTVRALTK